MQPLADFLNHGILPFVGRATELERITQFWQTTTEAHGLRVLCIAGEAGVGKSRLIDMAMKRIVPAGGTFIHVKLYPESTTSIAPLVAHAIWRSAAGRRLLAGEPEGYLPDVVAALSRIARLRPTILVIEDIHLLNGETLRDFGGLLGALEGELLSVLCVARPMDTGSRGVIERYLVDEIELQGLSGSDITELWDGVFETSAENNILSAMMEATAGNPLAIRSALRGAISTGTLALDTARNTWRTTVPHSAFLRRLQENVRLISEGLATHLTPRERTATEQLASLGEVLSHEAACAMLDDADRMLRSLVFKGILVTATSSLQPIPGIASDYPLLTFAHTLVHKHFIQQAEVDTGRILKVITDNLPLYSLLPFQLLAMHGTSARESLDDIRSAFRRSIDVARLLDLTPDWEMGKQALHTAQALIESHRDRWNDEEWRELCSELVHFKLVLCKREMHTKEYEGMVMQFLDLTESPMTETLLRCRLVALAHLYWVQAIRRRPQGCEPLRHMEELLERFPDLRYGNAYSYFLYKVAHSASTLSDRAMLRTIDEKLSEFLAQEEVPGERRRTAWQMISPFLLSLFDTEEELQHRLDTLARLEDASLRNDDVSAYSKIVLLEEIGKFEEMFSSIENDLPGFIERGLWEDAFHVQLCRISGQAATGVPLETIETELRTLVDRSGPLSCMSLARLARMVTLIGTLRDDLPWTQRLLHDHAATKPVLPFELRILLALDRGEGNELGSLLSEEHLHPTLWKLVGTLLGTDSDDPEEVRWETEQLLKLAPLRTTDLLRIRTVIILAESIAVSIPSFLESLRPQIHASLLRSIEWLEKRGAVSYLESLLQRFDGYLTSKERGAWRKRTDRNISQRKQERSGSTTIHLSMLGSIEIRSNAIQSVRVRGARLRVLLGLMVADQMLDHPLAQSEFLRIAAGDEHDHPHDGSIDHARNIVKVTIHRLREILGHDTILTDAETPRLNPHRVEIDLLTVHSLLREATEAARQNVLARARTALGRALDLIGQDVAFPSLYDRFFEAARDDFEAGLRATLLSVTQGLMREGDAASAEDLLNRGFRLMPEDEELADLLRNILSSLGKHTDAERVRLKVTEEVEA